jgi:hypothetical protein
LECLTQHCTLSVKAKICCRTDCGDEQDDGGRDEVTPANPAPLAGGSGAAPGDPRIDYAVDGAQETPDMNFKILCGVEPKCIAVDKVANAFGELAKRWHVGAEREDRDDRRALARGGLDFEPHWVAFIANRLSESEDPTHCGPTIARTTSLAPSTSSR